MYSVNYWCSDSIFRGCILRKLFLKLDYDVIVPAAPPNPSTGKLKKKGSMFSIPLVTRFLYKRGCPELLEIDKKWGVKPSSKGDIDILLSNKVNYIVAEVKTRLIPHSATRWGFSVTELMLQYHLDEPVHAEKAWKSLVKLGIVAAPKSGGRGSYDNPASISELVRSVTASYLNYTENVHDLSLIPSVITACYAKPFLDMICESVNRSRNYLAKCGIPVKEAAVILVKLNVTDTPKTGLIIDCFGKGCNYLNLPVGSEIIINLSDECPQYLRCDRCKYYRYCKRLC